MFRDQEMLVWSINNYLGLANHPEVRKVDAESAAAHGLSTPMGARMMSGNSVTRMNDWKKNCLLL